MKRNTRKYGLPDKILLASLLCQFALAATSANATMLDATAGGSVTFNYDNAAFAQYAGGNSSNPGYYLANFWDGAASDPYDANNTTAHFAANLGNTQISMPLVHDITPVGAYAGTQATGRHVQGTSAHFAIDSETLTGISGEQIGMTGVQGYYLPNFPAPYNYVIAGDFSLAYDPSARASEWGTQAGAPTGWYIKNNLGFGLVTYDLANLSVVFADAHNWKLSGSLLMAPGYADMLMGPAFVNVGTFDLGVGSYAVSNVPLPAAAWMFITGLMGLLAVRRKPVLA